MTNNFFPRLTIHKKIILSFGILVLLYIAVAVIGSIQIENATLVVRETVPHVEQMKELQEFAVLLELFDRQIDKFSITAYLEHQEQAKEYLDNLFLALQSLQKGNYSRTHSTAHFNELASTLTLIEQNVDKLIMLSAGQISSVSANKIMISLFSQLEYARQLHNEITQEIIASIRQELFEGQRLLENVNQQFTFLGIALILLGIFLSSTLSRMILHPVTDLLRVAQDIANGDLTKRAVVGSKDEIGKLAQSLNQMTEHLLEARKVPESILRSMKDSLFVINNEGVITKVNQAALEVLGYTKEELVSKPISKVFSSVKQEKRKSRTPHS